MDGLGWAEELCITSFGLNIGLRTSNASAMDAVRECLPPFWKPSDSHNVDRIYSVFVGEGKKTLKNMRLLHVIYFNETRLIKTTNFQQALHALDNDLQLYVAEYARRKVFVHSGVVNWKGMAIIMPGRTFSGKSTLVDSLVKAGASYFSDEYAVLDSWGRVHPYPRPLKLRCNQSGQSCGLPIATDMNVLDEKAVPTGLILITNYKRGASWRPQLMSPGHAILKLTANSIPARRKPLTVLKALKTLALKAPCFESDRGESEDVARKVLDLLEYKH